MYNLSDLVYIHNGITTVKTGGNPCRLLLAKSIDKGGIDYTALENVFATSKIKPIQKNDILVVNRGKFSVGLVGDDVPEGGDISTPSFVFTLRVRGTDILPAYIHYYLNTDKVQNRLRSMQQGGSIQFVSKSDLSDIKIPLPCMETQHTIANLYTKIMALQLLRQQQISLLENYINGLPYTYIKQGMK